MIYADGAGATILEAVAATSPSASCPTPRAPTPSSTRVLLWMGKSYNPDSDGRPAVPEDGRPQALRVRPDDGAAGRQGEPRQGRADPGRRSTRSSSTRPTRRWTRRSSSASSSSTAAARSPPEIMPMTISWLGNSSVATVPTLLDLSAQGQAGRPAPWPRRHRRLRLRGRGHEHQLGGLPPAVRAPAVSASWLDIARRTACIAWPMADGNPLAEWRCPYRGSYYGSVGKIKIDLLLLLVTRYASRVT